MPDHETQPPQSQPQKIDETKNRESVGAQANDQPEKKEELNGSTKHPVEQEQAQAPSNVLETKKPAETLTERNAASTEPNAAPTEPNAAPTEPNVPTEPNTAPTEPNAAPTEPNAAPAGQNAAPIEQNAATKAAKPGLEPSAQSSAIGGERGATGKDHNQENTDQKDFDGKETSDGHGDRNLSKLPEEPPLKRVESENMEAISAAQELEKEKAEEDKRKQEEKKQRMEDFKKRREERLKLIEEKQKFQKEILEVTTKIRSLKTSEKREELLQELEAECADILDAKASSATPNEFRVKILDFDKDAQRKFQLFNVAQAQAHAIEYKEKMSALSSNDEKINLTLKATKALTQLRSLPPETQDLHLFNATPEQIKLIHFGQAAVRELEQQRQLQRQQLAMRGMQPISIPFTIPPNYKHPNLPLPVGPPEKREFILLNLTPNLKPGIPYNFPFVRANFPMRITLPANWDRSVTGGMVPVKMGGVIIRLYVPPGIKGGDTILREKQKSEQIGSSGTQKSSFSGLQSGFLNNLKKAQEKKEMSSKKVSKVKSSKLATRTVVPGEWDWGMKDAMFFGGLTVFIGGISYFLYRRRKNDYEY